MRLVEEWKSKLDKGYVVGAILMDLSTRAFELFKRNLQCMHTVSLYLRRQQSSKIKFQKFLRSERNKPGEELFKRNLQ